MRPALTASYRVAESGRHMGSRPAQKAPTNMAAAMASSGHSVLLATSTARLALLSVPLPAAASASCRPVGGM